MTDNTAEHLHQIIEAALFAAGEPLNVERLLGLFDAPYQPTQQAVRQALNYIGESYVDSGIELVEVASGFRLQVRVDYAPWLQRLWEKKPPRYTRALLETLALIAYRQPTTRGEIERVRGVSVSPNIIKTLLDREWIKVVGYKEVPGRPALFATTKFFLDDFNLKRLSDLPPLADLADLDAMEATLEGQLELAIDDVPDSHDKPVSSDGVSSCDNLEGDAESQEVVLKREAALVVEVE